MSVEEQIGNLVERLSGLKSEYFGMLAQLQPDLRQYVVSRQYPLEDRFEVWAEWCEKEHHDLINDAEVPLFGKMVGEDEPYEYDKHGKFDWVWFLDAFEDSDLREKYGVTKEDVMERLIATNFGSFIMDW